MGVNKLWDILLTIAIPNHIEDLSGLILAIDASLWILKINSIFQNVDQGLKCIFNKIIWLKKNNIKPIFVFDGDTPALKRRTLQQRRNKRRELNNLDIKKKVQIQIVKTVTGNHSQKSQKQSIKNAYDQKAQEIDKMLNNLIKYENSANTVELTQKVAMQAEVLNKKYQLFCEINNNIPRKFGQLQYFSSLDIETKQQILQEIQINHLPSGRDVRRLKQSMSQEQKIMYDMQIIKKKSKILELQDNLYRKVMTKKIQNGYEIIEGVYNGKKVLQKKKIKSTPFNQWGLKFGKKDTCNNFNQILKKSVSIQQSEHSNSNLSQQEDKGDFFSKIFSKNYNNQKRQSSQSTFQQLSQRISGLSNNPKRRTHKQKKNKKKQTKQHQQQYNIEDLYGTLELQPKKADQNRNEQLPDNADNFPDYIMMQKLGQLPSSTSNNNIHFQNMLDIMGINYITAPFEAEAQCAALEEMGLVDGVVTEDSDVFLFGARRVYRGLFQDNIKLYQMDQVQHKLFLTREKLVLFALMLGSDYTDGIKGIGIVNAMEILKIHHDIDSLQRFTDWAKSADILHQDQKNKTDYLLQNAICQDERQFYQLHKKFKNYWHIHPSFPQRNIYDAYIQPQVQSDNQIQKRVKEGKKINSQALKILMEQKFKMVPLQIQLNFKIIQKSFEKMSQTQITQYTSGNLAKIVSKRLQKAINLGDNSN